MRHNNNINEITRGRWRGILTAIGLSERFLNARHGPCPLCGGKDRYRWDNKNGEGTYFCSGCGAGSGVDLVMKFLGLEFVAACRRIETHVGAAKFEMPKANTSTNYVGDKIWDRSMPLAPADPATMYLQSRGLHMSDWPKMIRFAPSVEYRHEDGSRTNHPAMVSRFLSPDNKSATTHITHLTENGQKADVPKVKMLAPGKVPDGGAVRLCHSAETMGIAEGIETAIGAMLMHDVPVWAALNAITMAKWQPPPNVKHVLIFGDNDASFTGHKFAYALANRLRTQNKLMAYPKFPDDVGTDWNDEYLGFLNSARDAQAVNYG